MIAEIMTNHPDLADVFWLVAVVLAVLAALAAWPHPQTARASAWATSLAALALACVAFGLMAL
jgi:CHASE2 domain-containing sensor protein